MFPPHRNRRPSRARRHDVLRRAVVVTMLLTYATTALGVPLPLGERSANNGDGAYPCAAGACGCRSAEHCWTSCCCHTLAERLAWAQRRGIRPPREAIEEARRQGLDVSWLDGPGDAADVSACGADGDCAAAHRCRGVASPRIASQDKECCSERSQDALADTVEPTSSESAILLSALRCQGKSINWLAAVVQIVDVQPIAMGDAPLVDWLAPPALCLASSCEAAPPVPPPEPVRL